MVTFLHSDVDLAKELEHRGKGSTHLDVFQDRFVENFTEDLDFIGKSIPPFVSDATFKWMVSETHNLNRLAQESQAFEHPSVTPIHWDLWENNILVTRDGQWYLLDWDGLSLGDPALDYAILTWPLTHGRDGVDWQELSLPQSDPQFADRMQLYQRAIMLDWVVDVLADWLDADQAPAHCANVRRQKQHDHLTYLALYRDTYG